MEAQTISQNPQAKLVQDLVEAGKQAFDPSLGAVAQQAGLRDYDDLIKRTETWALLPALNTLVKPDVLPSWLSQAFMKTLTLVPLRPDGVRGTVEFVFSVHPSSSSRAADVTTPHKQGASITQEAVAVATRLLSSVPASMSPEAWFGGISGQLFHLMDGKEGSDLARTTAQIVGFGILGRRQLGAPGAPGWNVFVQPLLEAVNPSLRSDSGVPAVDSSEEVIDLSQDRVMVPSESLERSLGRLKVLILSNPSPGLCRRVMKPILVQLWCLASWPGLVSSKDSPRGAARAMVATYLRLFGQEDTMDILIQHALCKGSLPDSSTPWAYRPGQGGDISIVARRSALGVGGDDVDWTETEEKAGDLAGMIVTSCSPEDVSSLFLRLLRRWIKTTGESSGISLLKEESPDQDSESPLRDLFEVTLLQKLLDKAPEKLVSQFDQLLDLISQVLKVDGQTRMSDDLVGVVLSLLNLVATTPTFQKSDIKKDELEIIEASLDRLTREDRGQTSQTASNLALLLKYRGDMGEDDDEDAASAPSSRQVADRRTYNLAMNYITGADNPPPVVSEGINLLSGLIQASSPILDITAVGVLLSKLLANGEDYINLRVVKTFAQLASKHPRSTVKEILDHYLDARERESTDTRLRFGEALLQVIERQGEAFTGEVAQQVAETLLSIAGRRGYRPKTKAKQEREERLRDIKEKEKKKKAKNGEDLDEGDGEMDDMDEMTEEEQAQNDALAQIVQGWDSKRGAEDVRMRTSALSIFGTALETNIGGVGPSLASGGVDLCIKVLTLEREAEKGILRRAAIVAVLSFIRALQAARESGRSLGFGLTDASREDIGRTLEYVAATDNDGLVKQHARDVVESLQSWQMASVLPTQREAEGPGVGRLAGLSINPGGGLVDAAGRPRPRIEEIE